jgi:HemY protein
MIRLIAYLLIVAGAASGLAWIADRPGSLTIEWLGYDIRTSVFIAAIAIVVFFALFSLAVWLGILTWTAPRRFARRMERHRKRIGADAVWRGIFAAGAGDRLAAMKADVIAKRNVPDEPLTLLLEAQAAQLNEDPIASRQAFERMLEKPEMAELGLRGLYIEAKKAGQIEAAKQFAERALATNQALTWSSTALFDMQCRECDWRGALRTLDIAKQNRHLSKDEANRRRAILLTQLAIELEDTQQGKALAYATEAFDLSPALVPAAVLAGRILTSQGNTSRATKLLAKAWKAVRHPEIALILAHCRRGDSPRDRLARMKTLVAGEPPSVEGATAVAAAAIEARDWSSARLALDPYLSSSPPARVCRLMARIEAGENRDTGRAREWMAKAARGAPDPTWVASDGSISTEWQPVSPISGVLGAFEWKTPPMASTDGDDFIAEITAMDASAAEAEELPRRTDDFDPEGKEVSQDLVALENVADQPLGASSPPRLALGFDSEASRRPIDRDVEMEERSSNNAEGQGADIHNGMSSAGEGAPAVGKPKPDRSSPAIFIPGPAPDDPGPRSSEIEDASTLLTRYRRPL